jgi:hypothetical protein
MRGPLAILPFMLMIGGMSCAHSPEPLAPAALPAVASGYAPVNGLKLYYEDPWPGQAPRTGPRRRIDD